MYRARPRGPTVNWFITRRVMPPEPHKLLPTNYTNPVAACVNGFLLQACLSCLTFARWTRHAPMERRSRSWLRTRTASARICARTMVSLLNLSPQAATCNGRAACKAACMHAVIALSRRHTTRLPSYLPMPEHAKPLLESAMHAPQSCQHLLTGRWRWLWWCNLLHMQQNTIPSTHCCLFCLCDRQG